MGLQKASREKERKETAGLARTRRGSRPRALQQEGRGGSRLGLLFTRASRPGVYCTWQLGLLPAGPVIYCGWAAKMGPVVGCF